jgi:hypothetical protein
MVGTEDGSRYAVPFRVIPERGQVPKYLAHPSSKEAWNVLHEDVSGSKLANDPRVFRPEPSGIVLRESQAVVADRLAGESAGEHVDMLHRSGVHIAHILVAGNTRPVAGQHTSTERVALAVPHHSHTGSLKAELPAADSREEATDRQHPASRRASSCATGVTVSFGWPESSQ